MKKFEKRFELVSLSLWASLLFLACPSWAASTPASTSSGEIDFMKGILGEKSLRCSSTAGDHVSIWVDQTGDIMMSADVNTDGYSADNDDGPPQCMGSKCSVLGSSYVNTEDSPMTVKAEGGDLVLHIMFGDDNQNSFYFNIAQAALEQVANRPVSAISIYNPETESATEPEDLPHKVPANLECGLESVPAGK